MLVFFIGPEPQGATFCIARQNLSNSNEIHYIIETKQTPYIHKNGITTMIQGTMHAHRRGIILRMSIFHLQHETEQML